MQLRAKRVLLFDGHARQLVQFAALAIFTGVSSQVKWQLKLRGGQMHALKELVSNKIECFLLTFPPK